MNFGALILAGGRSSRMGRDKALLQYAGEPLIRRQIDAAREAGAVDIVISGRAENEYSGFGCPVLRDRFVDAGPLSGIERGLAAARHPLLLVLAVDLPHMTVKFLRYLADQCGEGLGVIPAISGLLEPLVAIYPREAHSIAVAQLEAGDFAVKDFAAACVRRNLARMIIPGEEYKSCFLNWNSPADLA